MDGHWTDDLEVRRAALEALADNPVARAYEEIARAKAEARRTPTWVHLVVFERGGLTGAYLDEIPAHRAAMANGGGVVVSLPATADYRS